jgi:hypothetical protein
MDLRCGCRWLIRLVGRACRVHWRLSCWADTVLGHRSMDAIDMMACDRRWATWTLCKIAMGNRRTRQRRVGQRQGARSLADTGLGLAQGEEAPTTLWLPALPATILVFVERRAPPPLSHSLRLPSTTPRIILSAPRLRAACHSLALLPHHQLTRGSCDRRRLSSLTVPGGIPTQCPPPAFSPARERGST